MAAVYEQTLIFFDMYDIVGLRGSKVDGIVKSRSTDWIPAFAGMTTFVYI